MTERGLAEILLKLLGVYWLVVAAQALLSFASYRAVGPAGWTYLLSPFIFALGYAALGWLLIAKAPAIAARLAPKTSDASEPITTAAAHQIAFSLLGVYLATVGAAALIGDVAEFGLLGTLPSPGMTDEAFQGGWAAVTTHLVYLAVGIGLTIGSRRLSRFWRRLHPLAERDADAAG
jgi:hypothetical protein